MVKLRHFLLRDIVALLSQAKDILSGDGVSRQRHAPGITTRRSDGGCQFAKGLPLVQGHHAKFPGVAMAAVAQDFIVDDGATDT